MSRESFIFNMSCESFIQFFSKNITRFPCLYNPSDPHYSNVPYKKECFNKFYSLTLKFLSLSPSQLPKTEFKTKVASYKRTFSRHLQRNKILNTTITNQEMIAFFAQKNKNAPKISNTTITNQEMIAFFEDINSLNASDKRLYLNTAKNILSIFKSKSTSCDKCRSQSSITAPYDPVHRVTTELPTRHSYNGLPTRRSFRRTNGGLPTSRLLYTRVPTSLWSTELPTSLSNRRNTYLHRRQLPTWRILHLPGLTKPTTANILLGSMEANLTHDLAL